MSMKYQVENILTIISNSNMSYIRWDKQNSWGFRQVYSLHLDIMDRDLGANCPCICVPVSAGVRNYMVALFALPLHIILENSAS